MTSLPPPTTSNRLRTDTTSTSGRAVRRGLWSRAVGPRWRSRQAPISATSAGSTGTTSATAHNRCRRAVLSGGRRRGKAKGGGGNYQPKWCSEHNTTKHSDAECSKQKELQGLAANLALLQQAGQANFLNIGSAHLAQSSPTQPSEPEPTTFGLSLIHI